MECSCGHTVPYEDLECPECGSCPRCCSCDELYDADELGLDPEEDDRRRYA